MGGDPVTGKSADDLLVVVHHHIDQEGGLCHGAGFHHVGVDGVAVGEVGAADLRVGPCAEAGIQGQVMVFHDGLPAGDARQDALAAAAEARHEMVHHTAGKDDMVALQGTLVQPHRGPPGGGAHILEVCLIRGLVVHQANAVVNRLCHQADVLLLCLAAVGAGGGDDEHVLIPDTGGLQLLHQNGDVGLGRLPAAGHIRDNDAHRLPRLYQLFQRFGVDGMLQGVVDVLRHSPLGQVHMVGLQLRRDQLRRQRYLKFLPAIFHCFCHA